MDLITLNSSNYNIDKLIEGYDSLIWTERYTVASEFKLTTYNIRETKSALPLDSFVSLLDSLEVMMVETHEIVEDSDGVDQLIVTGRSVETFLEGRSAWAEPSYIGTEPISWARWVSYYESRNNADLAALAIFASVVSTISHDRPNELLPGVAVTHTLQSTYGGDQNALMERGDTYSAVLKFLDVDNLGIRSLRPPGSGNRISFNASGGKLSTTMSFTSTLRFDIYDGIFRTGVNFSQDAGHIDNPRHLWTKRGLKNVAWAKTPVMGYIIPRSAPEAYGFDRRLQIMEFGEEFNTFAKITKQAVRDMNQTKNTDIFSGLVSPSAPYTYGVDYNLGDLVMMSGKYTDPQIMRVTEYIRTEDQEGERGYPTLSTND